jgi:hypothetical protein
VVIHALSDTPTLTLHTQSLQRCLVYSSIQREDAGQQQPHQQHLHVNEGLPAISVLQSKHNLALASVILDININHAHYSSKSLVKYASQSQQELRQRT